MTHLRREGRQVVTRTGAVHVVRHVYYCHECGRTHAPLDEALGLDGTQYSKRARQWCLRIGAALPFAEGEEMLRELTAVQADASVIEAFCARAGSRMEEDVQARTEKPASPAACAHEHLYVGVDGVHAPIRDDQRPWQEVRTGVVFTATAGTDGPTLDQREYLAFLGTMEDFAPRLWECASRWGALHEPHITFLGDGAPANWSLAELLFPGAMQILDFYHACEHLRAIRDLLFGADDPGGITWLDQQCHRLKAGRWNTVMATIRALRPRRGCARRLRTEAEYFVRNRHRMRYLHFRRLGLYIGSGVVESVCKQIVTRRIKVSGARWKPDSCQGMLHLRCAYLSNPTALLDAA